MQRHVALALFLLAPAMAFAQTVPEDAARDLWCGVALGVIAGEAPADLPAERRDLVARFAEGGALLIDRARTAHLENGYTEEQFADHLAALEVTATPSPDAPFSFEECLAVLETL